MRTLALALLLTLAGTAVADEGDELTVLRPHVGEAVPLRLGWPAVKGHCDDPAIVRVEDGGDHLLLRGLKPGRTLCGFWRWAKSPYPSEIVDVRVE